MTATDPTGHWPSFVDKALKKVTKKVKKVTKTAWKKTKAAAKKVAKVTKAAAKKVKKVVKKVVKKAKRVVRKAVHYVSDKVVKAKKYVKRTYKAVKKVAHKVTKTVKAKAKAAAKVVKHTAKKVVKQAKKVGKAVKKAAKATANFVKQHAGTIVSVAVGVAVFAGCTAATGGVGVIGCGMLAGAAANAVGYAMSDGPKSLGGFAAAVGVGALTGALGGAAGGVAVGAVSRLLAGVGGRTATGAAMGAAGGGAEGVVGYGISCAAQRNCTASGAATSMVVGAATGGALGAAASRFGPKADPQPQANSQPASPRPSGCRTGKTPHSFTGLTGVLMANGTVKPISEVKAGDQVLTAEPGKKEKEKHKVKEVIVTKTDRDYVDVVVKTDAGPKTIETTKHHQFYEITRNSWTQAGDLKPGQELQDGEGEPARILDVTAYTAERTTYDLSVEGLHTYHVVAGATPVLVHNCSTGGLSLSDARHVSGRFPKTAKPGETLFRQKEDGTVTAYARYDEEGAISQRADLDPNSASHAGIPAPHILDMAKHVNPKRVRFFVAGRRRRGLYAPRKSCAAAGRPSQIWMADMQAVHK
ncbi:hypothetical protein EQG64_12700 [Streptomyces sp. S6]|nr:hypothetical protein EQG64_12700 [Streptomyces sp. S6]